MSVFILVGIIVVLGVNWLYSRFCENVTKDSPQFLHRKTHTAAGRPMGVRF